MQKSSLLRERRFAPLFATQFLGALNDNLFKNALVVLALFAAGSAGPVLVAAAGGLFILPYVLFSSVAGQLADRTDKAVLIRRTKWLELALMVLAAAGFLLGSLPLLFAVLFGLGVQATFFSPLKYGILPERLAPGELVAGNGLVEAGTFLGILGGTIAGGALVLVPGGAAIVSAAGVAVALLGLLASRAIPRGAAADPGARLGWNVAAESLGLLHAARANPPVWRAVLLIGWFWTLGAVLLAAFPVVAKDALGAGGEVVTLMLTLFALGVGLGSVLAPRLLRGAVSARHVPFATLGLTLFIADFAWSAAHAAGLNSVASVLAAAQGWRLLLDLLLIGACGGLYSVPLYAMLQAYSAPAQRARMIACNNLVNAICMVVGATAQAGLAAAGFAATTTLLLMAGLNLLVLLDLLRSAPARGALPTSPPG